MVGTIGGMCTDAEFAALVAASKTIGELRGRLCSDDASLPQDVRARVKILNLSTRHFTADRTRIADSDLLAAVATSSSMTEVLAALGIRLASGSLTNYTRRARLLAADMSHFKAKEAVRRGRRPDEVFLAMLVLRPEQSPRAKTKDLRKAMLLTGRPHACAKCSILTWGGEELTLEIDHINGNPWDDRIENLRFLCPNCHSLETRRLRKTRAKEGRGFCQECSASIRAASIRCVACAARLTQAKGRGGSLNKIVWPEAEAVLTRLAAGESYEALGRELGVSGNAVKKYLRRNGIEPPKKYERTGKYSKKTDGA
jgi:hypothetical protein